MGMFDLTGRVALVTGGNGGIGFGIAEGLAAAGCRVVINGRNVEKTESAAQAIRDQGGAADGLVADLSDADSCKGMIAETVAMHGRLDILVNNSGINFRKLPQDFSLEDWHSVIDTNLTAPFVLSQAAHPHFVEQGGGKIIMIGSIAAFMGSPVGVAYSPSKGGITQLARALAVAWASQNIQINTIHPGWIDTPLSQSARAGMPGLEEAVLARTPAGRWGQPSDFAGAAVFLASPSSDFVNGATLVIDGGYSVRA